MPYQVELTSAAAKDLRALDPDSRNRIGRQIDKLAMQPRPRGASKLQGRDDTYRVRVGTYRILYEVSDKKLLIIVIRVRHRRDVYRSD